MEEKTIRVQGAGDRVQGVGWGTRVICFALASLEGDEEMLLFGPKGVDAELRGGWKWRCGEPRDNGFGVLVVDMTAIGKDVQARLAESLLDALDRRGMIFDCEVSC